MALVDHDISKTPQEDRPPPMVGQHTVIQHVRISQYERRVSPNPVALGGRRVAVVSSGTHPGQIECTNRTELVVRQRLGRSEVQRPGRWSGQQTAEHRHEVSQRLARSGARRQHDAASAVRMLGGERLMNPWRVNPRGPQPCDQYRIHPRRPGRPHTGPSRDVLHVCDTPPTTGTREKLIKNHRATIRRALGHCGSAHSSPA